MWECRKSSNPWYRGEAETASYHIVSLTAIPKSRFTWWNWNNVITQTPTPFDSFEHLIFAYYCSTIPAGICAWIGASNINSVRRHRWIELPPNYGDDSANGELLTETYNNFWSGIIFIMAIFLVLTPILLWWTLTIKNNLNKSESLPCE